MGRIRLLGVQKQSRHLGHLVYLQLAFCQVCNGSPFCVVARMDTRKLLPKWKRCKLVLNYLDFRKRLNSELLVGMEHIYIIARIGSSTALTYCEMEKLVYPYMATSSNFRKLLKPLGTAESVKTVLQQMVERISDVTGRRIDRKDLERENGKSAAKRSGLTASLKQPVRAVHRLNGDGCSTSTRFKFQPSTLGGSLAAPTDYLPAGILERRSTWMSVSPHRLVRLNEGESNNYGQRVIRIPLQTGMNRRNGKGCPAVNDNIYESFIPWGWSTATTIYLCDANSEVREVKEEEGRDAVRRAQSTEIEVTIRSYDLESRDELLESGRRKTERSVIVMGYRNKTRLKDKPPGPKSENEIMGEANRHMVWLRW
ncbi:14901_t:CDS:10 [Funneliformis mosseae]|uniref:14901_t:CDS:1 n=1 Tax=Funneliformis mosseae TaxID=27381 RepID=A0A9N9F4B5_FUNMO|nr:14901_t:CDS:10 [Funneliformis mosseae]